MISCHEYDYIEIACMYRYEVKVCMVDNTEITGIALDTTRNEKKQECLKLSIKKETKLIVLNRVASLTVLTKNPHFECVRFS